MPKGVTLNDLAALAAQLDGRVEQRSDGKTTWYHIAIKGDEIDTDKKTTAATFLHGYLAGYRAGSNDHSGPLS